MHDAKALKIRPLWHVFLDYFIIRPSIKNLHNHLWPLDEKSALHIFDKLSGCKINNQNMQGGLILVILTVCICSILNSCINLGKHMTTLLSYIKTAPCCRKSSAFCKFNSLNFFFVKISAITVQMMSDKTGEAKEIKDTIYIQSLSISIMTISKTHEVCRLGQQVGTPAWFYHTLPLKRLCIE